MAEKNRKLPADKSAEIKNTPVIEDNEIDVLRHNGYCTSIECLMLNHGFEKLKEVQMMQKVSF